MGIELGTLPSTRPGACMPLLPTTTRSAPTSSATIRTVSAGSPGMAWTFTLTGAAAWSDARYASASLRDLLSRDGGALAERHHQVELGLVALGQVGGHLDRPLG